VSFVKSVFTLKFKIMKRLVFTLLFAFTFTLFPPNDLNAGMFATMKQNVIYDSFNNSESFTVTESGVTYTYSFSGQVMIGVQNECQFAFFSSCNSLAQNVTMRESTIFNIPENSQQ